MSTWSVVSVRGRRVVWMIGHHDGPLLCVCSWCCWLRVAAGGTVSAHAGWSITGSTRTSTKPCPRSRWPTITSFEEMQTVDYLILSTHCVLFNQGRRDCALVVCLCALFSRSSVLLLVLLRVFFSVYKSKQFCSTFNHFEEKQMKVCLCKYLIKNLLSVTYSLKNKGASRWHRRTFFV